MVAPALLSARRLTLEAIDAINREQLILASELLTKAVELALSQLDRIEGAVNNAIVITAGPEAAENGLDILWQQLVDDPLTQGMKMKKNGDSIEVFLGEA